MVIVIKGNQAKQQRLASILAKLGYEIIDSDDKFRSSALKGKFSEKIRSKMLTSTTFLVTELLHEKTKVVILGYVFRRVCINIIERSVKLNGGEFRVIQA